VHRIGEGKTIAEALEITKHEIVKDTGVAAGDSLLA